MLFNAVFHTLQNQSQLCCHIRSCGFWIQLWFKDKHADVVQIQPWEVTCGAALLNVPLTNLHLQDSSSSFNFSCLSYIMHGSCLMTLSVHCMDFLWEIISKNNIITAQCIIINSELHVRLCRSSQFPWQSHSFLEHEAWDGCYHHFFTFALPFLRHTHHVLSYIVPLVLVQPNPPLPPLERLQQIPHFNCFDWRAARVFLWLYCFWLFAVLWELFFQTWMLYCLHPFWE